MAKLYKFLPLIFALKACGTQDYGDSEPTPLSQEPYDWMEAVENSRLLSPAPVRGPSPSKTLAASGLKESRQCPSESVCIKAAFVGARQLTALSEMNPLFIYEGNEDEGVLTYKGDGHLYLEGEVIEIPSRFELRSCAKKTILSAREIEGTGKIRTSSSLCSTPNSGDLVLSALEIDRLILDTSGHAGRNGADADSQGHPDRARDGLTEPVAYSMDWGKPFRGKLCITELGCHWDGNPHPDIKYEENMSLIRRSHFFKIDDLEKFIADSAGDGKHWYCWVENQDDSDFYKHFYLSWKVNADFSKLNGGDATVYIPGENGTNGGSAGEITVVTLRENIREFRSAGGSGGVAGKSFSQQPGLGSKLLNPVFETEEIVWGWMAKCLRREKNLNGDWALYLGRRHSWGGKKTATLTVGKDHASGAPSSPILGHELEKRGDGFYGRDGQILYSPKPASNGLSGRDQSPRIRILVNTEEFEEAAKTETLGAEIPKSIRRANEP